MYGHTVPMKGLSAGDPVKAGQVIAMVAPRKVSKSHVPPHLHLTIGRSTGPVDYETLDWATIANRGGLQLIDPMEIIDSDHVLLEGGSVLWENPKS